MQFKVDGTNIGTAITSSPYTIAWSSTGVSDGSHTLYAVADDTSGNYATSSESVTVENTPVSISSILGRHDIIFRHRHLDHQPGSLFNRPLRHHHELRLHFLFNLLRHKPLHHPDRPLRFCHL